MYQPKTSQIFSHLPAWTISRSISESISQLTLQSKSLIPNANICIHQPITHCIASSAVQRHTKRSHKTAPHPAIFCTCWYRILSSLSNGWALGIQKKGDGWLRQVHVAERTYGEGGSPSWNAALKLCLCKSQVLNSLEDSVVANSARQGNHQSTSQTWKNTDDACCM